MLGRRVKARVREVMVLLITALVVGGYLLSSQRQVMLEVHLEQLNALAIQTARRLAEPLAGDNDISVNVVMRETLALAPVAQVLIIDRDGEVVRRGGQRIEGVQVVVPINLPDGGAIGQLKMLAPLPHPIEQQEKVFVLLTLALLALWGLWHIVLWRHQQLKHRPSAASGHRPAAAPAPQVTVQLRLSVVNFDQQASRLTSTALASVMRPYQQLLSKVADQYDGVVIKQLGDQSLVAFTRDNAADAMFAALSCGLLYLKTTRLAVNWRKAHQRFPLEFKALVARDLSEETSWRLCLAGVPGRLQLPWEQIEAHDLDIKAVYHADRSTVLRSGEHTVTMQPIEQLVYRYQAQINDQAARLRSELERDDDLSEGH